MNDFNIKMDIIYMYVECYVAVKMTASFRKIEKNNTDKVMIS